MDSWSRIASEKDPAYMDYRTTIRPYHTALRVLDPMQSSVGEELQPLNMFIGWKSCKLNIMDMEACFSCAIVLYLSIPHMERDAKYINFVRHWYLRQ